MAGYVKMFQSILDSTIWKQPAAITKVWLTMMAMADRDGVVTAAIPGLADRAHVSIATAEKALALFLAPDPYSKTPDHEGRRIEVVRGIGWRLLTYEMHREMMSAEDSREKNAERQRRFRHRRRFPRIEEIITRDGERCGICAKAVDPALADIDHVRSRNLGGGDEIENLQLAHPFCNTSKHDGSGTQTWRHESMPALPVTLPNENNYIPSGPSGSVSLLSRGSDLGPERASSNSEAKIELRAGPVTGHDLQRIFGQVRSAKVSGLPWQSVRVESGAATSMAELLNEDPKLRADIVPTMELLFDLAKAGKAGNRSADIIRQPSFAFGAWLSQWTALREALHGLTPVIPAAAKPRPPGEKAWQTADKVAEEQRGEERAQRRLAQKELDRIISGEKAVG